MNTINLLKGRDEYIHMNHNMLFQILCSKNQKEHNEQLAGGTAGSSSQVRKLTA